ncbi:MAG: DoxX family membrane protein [Pyrinomonadaceae bacterium]|nr:DoxX family membrane protein [Pyrinomonadaceae bacterium]
MQRLYRVFNEIDERITEWMARYGVVFLRVSLGIVFLWFGALKFFPGLSPAQDLATRTISLLTFGIVPAHVSILLLAVWECLIGIGLITNLFMRATLLLLFVQMLGTVTPLFMFPNEVFARLPYAPTLEGQYIIKNIVLISAGLVIGATVRGGRVIADPQQAARRAQVASEQATLKHAAKV